MPYLNDPHPQVTPRGGLDGPSRRITVEPIRETEPRETPVEEPTQPAQVPEREHEPALP